MDRERKRKCVLLEHDILLILFLLSITLLRCSIAPSRDFAPGVGTNVLITIRRGHELIHVYDADFAERVLCPHEYPVGP